MDSSVQSAKIKINTNILPEAAFMLENVLIFLTVNPVQTKFIILRINFIEDAKKSAMYLFWKIMV